MDKFVLINIWKQYHEELDYETFNKNCLGHYAKAESQFLYSLIRHLKPKLVLEMSPDQGLSTSIMLEAMDKNGIESILLSYDITDLSLKWDRKEGLVQRELLLGDVRETLTDEHLENTELFFIDSDHSYAFASWYSPRIELLKPGTSVIIHDWPMYDSMGACDNIIPSKAPPPIYQHTNSLEVSCVKQNLVDKGILTPILNITDWLKETGQQYHNYKFEGFSPSQFLIKN